MITLKQPIKNTQSGIGVVSIFFVLVMLGLLLGLIAPRIACFNSGSQARIERVYSDFHSLETALKLYHQRASVYPTTEQGLNALFMKPSVAPVPMKWSKLLDDEPQDPWGNVYYYRSPGQYGEFDIYTLGEDGTVGGEGLNKDRGNWEELNLD